MTMKHFVQLYRQFLSNDINYLNLYVSTISNHYIKAEEMVGI